MKLSDSFEIESSRELQIIINSEGEITSVSCNCYNILGLYKSEILNLNIKDLLNYDLNEMINQKNFSVPFLRKDGQSLYLDVQCKTYFDNADNTIISGVSLSIIDISYYYSLKEQYNQFVEIFQKAKDIVFKYQLIPEYKFTYLSPSVADILGYDREDYFKNPALVFELVHPDDIHIQQSKVDKHSDFSKTFCVRFKHKNGNYIGMEDYLIPTFNREGELISVEGICRNIQDRLDLEKKLEKLSYRDELTGLFNRTYLNRQLRILIDEVDMPIAVIVCDLDDLKFYNDNYGHSSGDILLKNVSNFLNKIFIKDSVVVRNGGDEFIILLTNISLKEAEKVYSKMLYCIEEYNRLNEIPIKLSSGFAYSPTSKSILDLLGRADKEMYKDKYEKKQGMRS